MHVKALFQLCFTFPKFRSHLLVYSAPCIATGTLPSYAVTLWSHVVSGWGKVSGYYEESSARKRVEWSLGACEEHNCVGAFVPAAPFLSYHSYTYQRAASGIKVVNNTGSVVNPTELTLVDYILDAKYPNIDLN